MFSVDETGVLLFNSVMGRQYYQMSVLPNGDGFMWMGSKSLRKCTLKLLAYVPKTIYKC